MINVGIVGYGKSAKIFHLPLLRILDEFSIEAFVSSQEELILENYPQAKVYKDLNHLLFESKVNLVIITTPNHLHYSQAKAALLAGKHVVIEKPFVIDPQDGRELIELAHEKNLKLSVYHNRRWDKGFMALQQLIAQNVLGEINHYEVHYDRWRPQVLNRWRESDENGAGLLYDLGSHMIDQVLFLFGKPDEIIADIEKQRKDAKSIDYFHLIFKYRRMRAILHASCLAKNPGPHLIVHGLEDSFIETEMDHQEADLMEGLNPTTYQLFYKQMARAILRNEPVPVDPEDALRVIEIIHDLEKVII